MDPRDSSPGNQGTILHKKRKEVRVTKELRSPPPENPPEEEPRVGAGLLANPARNKPWRSHQTTEIERVPTRLLHCGGGQGRPDASPGRGVTSPTTPPIEGTSPTVPPSKAFEPPSAGALDRPALRHSIKRDSCHRSAYLPKGPRLGNHSDGEPDPRSRVSAWENTSSRITGELTPGPPPPRRLQVTRLPHPGPPLNQGLGSLEPAA